MPSLGVISESNKTEIQHLIYEKSYYQKSKINNGLSCTDWWPSFQHDLLNSGYSFSNCPETSKLLWSFKTEDFIGSSPCIDNGLVYIGSRDNKFYCLDASNGACIWNFTTNNLIDYSPVIYKDRVYVGASDRNVYCLNKTTGEHYWTYPTSSTVRGLSADNNKLYISSDRLYCIDLPSVTIIWDRDTIYTRGGAPSIHNGKIYSTSFRDIECIDSSNGNLIWNFTTEGEIFSSISILDNNVYCSSHDGKIYCLNASTGNLNWFYQTNSYVWSTPAVAYDRIYVGSFDNHIYCLDAFTGELIWKYLTEDQIISSPAIADGKLFIGSFDFRFYCLNAFTGEFIWSFRTSYCISGSPAIADNKVFIGSWDKNLYCFSDNNPPDKPTIDGPTRGKTGSLYSYNFTAFDQDNDKIYYTIDFDNRSASSTHGPFDSGYTLTTSTVWSQQGTYTIRAKAKDEYGLESDWATLEVTMPKSRVSLWERLVERWPILILLTGTMKVI